MRSGPGSTAAAIRASCRSGMLVPEHAGWATQYVPALAAPAVPSEAATAVASAAVRAWVLNFEVIAFSSYGVGAAHDQTPGKADRGIWEPAGVWGCGYHPSCMPRSD